MWPGKCVLCPALVSTFKPSFVSIWSGVKSLKDNSEIYISNDSLIVKNINSSDSINYITFNYYKDQDSIFYIDELRKKYNLLSLFKDSILYSNSIDTLEIKVNNYNNKMPNINNDIAPNFNKR